MKLVFALSTVALLGVGLSAQAQTRPPARHTPPPRPVNKNAGVRDGVTMTDGKVMMTQNGFTTQLAEPTTLPSGTKVATDGTVTMANGSTTKLQNGDYMTLTGRLTTAVMKAQEDSLARAAKMDPKGKKGKRK